MATVELAGAVRLTLSPNEYNQILLCLPGQLLQFVVTIGCAGPLVERPDGMEPRDLAHPDYPFTYPMTPPTPEAEAPAAAEAEDAAAAEK